MNPKSIILYYEWRTRPKGFQLTNQDNTPVKDVNGNLLIAVGTWKSPVNVEQCQSAITDIHKIREQNNAYSEPCQGCIDEDQRNQFSGCRFHRGSARLWSEGNPTQCDYYENWEQSYEKRMKSYISKGDLPLNPMQVIFI